MSTDFQIVELPLTAKQFESNDSGIVSASFNIPQLTTAVYGRGFVLAYIDYGLKRTWGPVEGVHPTAQYTFEEGVITVHLPAGGIDGKGISSFPESRVRFILMTLPMRTVF